MAGILLFGGSFNPIHHGHLIVSRAAAEALGAERVVLVPSASPPHKRRAGLAPASDRLAMCQLAVEGDAQFEVSDWELTQDGPNYTLLTVRWFRAALPPGQPLYWLIGRDSLCELHTWYHIAALVDACTLVTVGRDAREFPALRELAAMLSANQMERLRSHYLSTPLIEISATDIRDRAESGASIRHLVPDAVRQYISSHRLYVA